MLWYNAIVLKENRKGETKMTLTKTVTIDIDIEQIIDEYRLDSNSKGYEIREAISDYVWWFDDFENKLINDHDLRAIERAVLEKLGRKGE